MRKRNYETNSISNCIKKYKILGNKFKQGNETSVH